LTDSAIGLSDADMPRAPLHATPRHGEERRSRSALHGAVCSGWRRGCRAPDVPDVLDVPDMSYAASAAGTLIGTGLRRLTFSRFQLLMTTMTKLSSAISSSLKCSRSLANSASLASLCGVSLTSSAQRSAARSRSVKNGASRQPARGLLVFSAISDGTQS
jgi:hypothetical protein